MWFPSVTRRIEADAWTMSSRFTLRDKDFSLNASLDAMKALERMGFTPQSVYREGNLIRIHCPIHKDLVRKSLIVDAGEKTYKCTYGPCPAHEGGLLIELIAMYFGCSLDEAPVRLFADTAGKTSRDLVFRGEMFINQGRAREALPYFEQAVAANTSDEITRCKLGALYLELNMKDEAYQEYLRAAESYAVRGELEKTLSIYNILIMLQPGAVKARKQLAVLFSRLGRPDAAVEQMKWVVDFYIQFGQIKGAIEAIEWLVEADTENARGRLLLGRLLHQDARRVQAMKEFEESARLFVASANREDALEVIEEGLQIAPGNPRLQSLKAQAESLPAREQPSSGAPGAGTEAEEAFIAWLRDVDEKLDLGEAPEALGTQMESQARSLSAEAIRPGAVAPAPTAAAAAAGAPPQLSSAPATAGPQTAPAPKPVSAPAPAAPAPPAPPAPKARPSAEAEDVRSTTALPGLPSAPLPPPARPPVHSAYETAEIYPSDNRVARCLDDMKDLSNDQVERMREEIVRMFNETRRTYEDGHLSEWEMRIVKEFYKAFNVAVEIRAKGGSSAAGAGNLPKSSPQT